MEHEYGLVEYGLSYVHRICYHGNWASSVFFVYLKSDTCWDSFIYIGKGAQLWVMHHFKGTFAAVSSLRLHVNTNWITGMFPVHRGCSLLLCLLLFGCFVHIFTGLPGMVAVRPCPSSPLLRSAVVVDQRRAHSAVPSALRSNPPPVRGWCTPCSTSWAALFPA